ncbi:hypothetical protein GCM10008967_16930 [Bacillus carboniphilus]|uniref:Spore coat protein n=1 Tax=Bacillus carboniphilus TaxID=86663 RepID=A0ABP3FV62_9BACI
MNQKIQNPETQVPKTPQMNDRDLINDLLSAEKYMTNAYSSALNEASHDQLYQDILQIFTDTQNAQRRLYNAMFQKGWYGLEAADQQQLQQSYDQFSGYKNQLPNGNTLPN